MDDLPASWDEAPEQGDGAGVDGEAPTIKITARIKKVRPKISPDLLLGRKGIVYVAERFPKIKFAGKRRELADLDLLMRNYETWAHNLFPKLPFSEVIQRCEVVGSKSSVKKRRETMRDLLQSNESLTSSLFSDEWALPGDDFDDLDAPPMEGGGPAPAAAGVPEDFAEFDMADFDEAEKIMREEMESAAAAAPPPTPTALTDDQKARMEENRRKALQRLQERKARAAAGAGATTASEATTKVVDDKEDGPQAEEVANTGLAGGETGPSVTIEVVSDSEVAAPAAPGTPVTVEVGSDGEAAGTEAVRVTVEIDGPDEAGPVTVEVVSDSEVATPGGEADPVVVEVVSDCEARAGVEDGEGAQPTTEAATGSEPVISGVARGSSHAAEPPVDGSREAVSEEHAAVLENLVPGSSEAGKSSALLPEAEHSNGKKRSHDGEADDSEPALKRPRKVD